MKEKLLNTEHRIIRQMSSIFKTPKAIISTEQDLSLCPYCASTLEQYHTLIPVGEGMEADIPGAWCRKCDKLYVKGGDSVRELIKDNKFAKGYTLDGEELWDFTNEKRRLKREEKRLEKKKLLFKARLEKLSGIPSSEVMICVRFDDKSYADYIIVSNKKDCTANEIIHYSSEEGRELISAAYAGQRKGNGYLDSKKYRVINRIYPHLKRRKISDHIVLTDLNIRPDGGYISSVKNAQMEIIDTLLFSLSTNKYEIIRSTLNKTTGECFVDIGLYRSFVKKYGRSELSPDFGYWSSYGTRSFDELNSESILKGYGYSVNKADGLSTSERRELLSEIVDLEILTVKRVVGLLDFFIQTHSNPVYMEARSKWESDKKYIQEYRVDPQRFLIARF